MRCLYVIFENTLFGCAVPLQGKYVYNALSDSSQLAISPLIVPNFVRRERMSRLQTHYPFSFSPLLVPTGPPLGLAVASRTTTSITVTWRCIPCTR